MQAMWRDVRAAVQLVLEMRRAQGRIDPDSLFKFSKAHRRATRPKTALTCTGKRVVLRKVGPYQLMLGMKENLIMKSKCTLFLTLVFAMLFGAHACAGIQLSVTIAPPPIAVFDQPVCPGDGYIWTPGYYQYGDYGYYWVPGQWVLPPSAGLLWTPGYWGFVHGRYTWHEGYWGSQVGFYGGINYGNGYNGSGFTGGRWEGNVFRLNTAVSKVDHDLMHNTYVDRTVVREVKGPNHAFNGRGGIKAQPSPKEVEVSRAPHQAPTKEQVSQAQEAHGNHLAAHGTPRE